MAPDPTVSEPDSNVEHSSDSEHNDMNLGAGDEIYKPEESVSACGHRCASEWLGAPLLGSVPRNGKEEIMGLYSSLFSPTSFCLSHITEALTPFENKV